MTDIPLRDEIANVIADAIDNEGDISPTLAADDLLAAFDISLRSPHPTPEEKSQ